MDIYAVLTIIVPILFGILIYNIVKILQRTEVKIEKLERNQKKLWHNQRKLINKLKNLTSTIEQSTYSDD